MGASERRRQRHPDRRGAVREALPRGVFRHTETGRLVSFVYFEDGRAIKQGSIHLESLIPKVGLEPTPSCEDRILSPVRLPYSWYWKHVGVILRVFGFMAATVLRLTDICCILIELILPNRLLFCCQHVCAEALDYSTLVRLAPPWSSSA